MTAAGLVQLRPRMAARAAVRGFGRRLCILTFLLATVMVNAATPATPFLMGSNADETSYVGRWNYMIQREAFRRMNIPLAFTTAPLKRITIMAEQGLVDGEISRAPAYGAAHPEMMAVDFPLMEVVFGIYTAKPMPGLNRVEDLRDNRLHGAYARGVLGCESVLLPVFASGQLTAVSTATNGLAMLAAGHADFYCDVSSSMANILVSEAGRKGLQPHKQFDLGPKVPLRSYVNKKHAAMVPLLAATLKQMKAEGLFERYWVESEKQSQAR